MARHSLMEDLEPEAIRHLYCRPDAAGRGGGRALSTSSAARARGIARLHSERASGAPIFQKQGHVISRHDSIREGGIHKLDGEEGRAGDEHAASGIPGRAGDSTLEWYFEPGKRGQRRQ